MSIELLQNKYSETLNLIVFERNNINVETAVNEFIAYAINLRSKVSDKKEFTREFKQLLERISTLDISRHLFHSDPEQAARNKKLFIPAILLASINKDNDPLFGLSTIKSNQICDYMMQLVYSQEDESLLKAGDYKHCFKQIFPLLKSGIEHERGGFAWGMRYQQFTAFFYDCLSLVGNESHRTSMKEALCLNGNVFKNYTKREEAEREPIASEEFKTIIHNYQSHSYQAWFWNILLAGKFGTHESKTIIALKLLLEKETITSKEIKECIQSAEPKHAGHRMTFFSLSEEPIQSGTDDVLSKFASLLPVF